MSSFLSERTMIVILTSLASITGIRCQSTVSDEPHFVEKLERCEKGRFVETADYEQRMSQMHQAIQMLQETMQNISNRLECVIHDTTRLRHGQQSPQQVRDKCGHTTIVRYYDIQFLFPPLLQCRPREELVCELRAICNPLLIQQNVDGSNFFNRAWDEFNVGFNDSNGNYWLGNELLHQLTMNNTYKLRFDLQSRDNNSLWFWAEYNTFTVDSETTNFTLQVGGFSGNVYSDALSNQNRMKFTTKDRDNDMSSGNCAQQRVGGFWYKDCALCSVNSGNSDRYYWGYLTPSNYYKLQTSRMWLICR